MEEILKSGISDELATLTLHDFLFWKKFLEGKYMKMTELLKMNKCQCILSLSSLFGGTSNEAEPSSDM